MDCESIFSQASFLADVREAVTAICFYERLVITKHRLHQIYCHLSIAKELYLKRFKNNNWDEGADWDAKYFFEIEKDVFLKDFKMCANLLDRENEGEEDEEDAQKCNEVIYVNENKNDNAVKNPAA